MSESRGVGETETETDRQTDRQTDRKEEGKKETAMPLSWGRTATLSSEDLLGDVVELAKKLGRDHAYLINHQG